ncbi:MAG: DNA adenine methylase [Armatimonadota bacterium]|nr:DNA adenine methylase [Armatimonadota bacterium]
MLQHEVFLKDQLIPYIGNKRKLLPLIHAAIRSTGQAEGVFLDLFSGSSVVSRLAKAMGYAVTANDWEPYTACINRTYICNHQPPPFVMLGGLESAIQRLNALDAVEGYIAGRYCPADDENLDHDSERLFYTQANGRRIDAIREQIAGWRSDGTIDEDEEAVLLAPLVFQAAYCSNTSGVFKGFHRGWGGATGTALYRIRSTLTLRPPRFLDNGRRNACLQADANEVAESTPCDIAYVDPPYNQHQYGSNYHMLNTVALWDKPPLEARFGNGSGDKAGIRKDWRTERRSRYCYGESAGVALAELVSRIRARHILVSYSTDGIIPVRHVLEILSERGKLDVFTHRYKRYRVSSQRPSARPYTVEFVLAADTTSAAGTRDAEAIERRIVSQAEESRQLVLISTNGKE